MSVLSSWLARRKQRRAIRKRMRQFIAGAIRSEKRAREVFMEVQNTDFATLWDDYAIAMGKSAETLALKEKQQAFLNHVLSGQE